MHSRRILKTRTTLHLYLGKSAPDGEKQMTVRLLLVMVGRACPEQKKYGVNEAHSFSSVDASSLVASRTRSCQPTCLALSSIDFRGWIRMPSCEIASTLAESGASIKVLVDLGCECSWAGGTHCQGIMSGRANEARNFLRKHD